MAEYLDLLIPLVIGVFFISSGGSLIKPTAVAYQKKRKILTYCGYGLLAVACLQAVLRYYS